MRTKRSLKYSSFSTPLTTFMNSIKNLKHYPQILQRINQNIFKMYLEQELLQRLIKTARR